MWTKGNGYQCGPGKKLSEEHIGLVPGQLLPWEEEELKRKVQKFEEGFKEDEGNKDEPSLDEPIYREQPLYSLEEEQARTFKTLPELEPVTYLCDLPLDESLRMLKIEEPKDLGTFIIGDRKSTRLNSSHRSLSRMPSSA